MIKILILISTSFVQYGGLTTVAMNYYRAMNKDGLSIDFASTNEASEMLIQEIKENGSHYFNVGNRKKNLIAYRNKLKRILSKGKYDTIHVHGNSATMFFELQIAKKVGVKNRIAQGHTTRSNYPRIHKLMNPLFKKSYTKAIAVSQQTGDWLFGDDYIVLNNAIDVEHYRFNWKKREEVRERFNIDDRFVIGNVGKLNSQKNHVYLLKVFQKVHARRPNAYLLIAGGGELEQKLRDIAMELGIDDSVHFFGMVDDTADILQAMDVFVFTSIFEGLGMALIEAQAAGLEILCSDVVPMETKVSPFINYISLDKSPEEWAEKTLTLKADGRQRRSEEAIRGISSCGYNIEMEAGKLEKIYRNE